MSSIFGTTAVDAWLVLIPLALGDALIMVKAFEHTRTSPNLRWAALITGNVIIALTLLATYRFLGIPPTDFWPASVIWVVSSPMGFGLALIVWATMATPIFTIWSCFRIEHARRMETRYGR